MVLTRHVNYPHEVEVIVGETLSDINEWFVENNILAMYLGSTPRAYYIPRQFVVKYGFQYLEDAIHFALRWK